MVAWARERGVVVASDECYISLGWDAAPVSVLHPDVCGGSHDGVLAVHSLSKRSNLAGYRAGFVTGDPALVADLLAISKQAGLIMPGPVQAAMAAALSDDTHAAEQRERYAARRSVLLAAFAEAGWAIDHSEAGLYLWATHPAHDCWSAAELLATEGGILVAPGELYGPAGKRHVRVALTATDERVAAAAQSPCSGCRSHRYSPASEWSTTKPAEANAERSAERRAAYNDRCATACASSPNAAIIAACTGSGTIIPACFLMASSCATSAGSPVTNPAR